ncbi:hypothetical protein QBZ16_000569 [Prototheca wickerhamii]|uniref:RRM domain-containing protein n=1 Tax=Prototheca wickerhamii TaxID=3111 RepID=A0AAD9MM70_PROWI|nr:hypothetical protein QBZ16_000569 [Prototheca wickerhamii]
MGPPAQPSADTPAPQETSRLCVKNLPKHATEKRIKGHFAEKGLITDAKLVKTRDGKSRCFAFIGYRTVEEAKEALKFFHGTYLDTSRLEVEFAQPFGKTPEHRPWSKYTPGSSAHKSIEEKRKLAEEGPPEKLTARQAIKLERAQKEAKKAARMAVPDSDDPKLAEFMQLMAPRSQKATWANDDGLDLNARGQGGSAGASGAGAGAGGAAASEAAPDAGKDGKKSKKKGKQEEEEREETPIEKDQVLVDDSVSHLDYLKSRQTVASFSDDEEEEETEAEEQAADGGAPEAGQDDAEEEDAPAGAAETGAADGTVQVAKEEASVADTGRLFLRNMPYTATDDELRALLEPFGEVQDVHIVKDRATGQSKGFAHVQFREAQDAVRALEALDGCIFQGRLLHILPGRPAPTSAEAEGAPGSAGFKAARAREQRAGAGTASSAWNSLFVRADTVAEAVAAHFGIPKSALLDRESPDVAVRLALGEAQVFAATKEALAEAGVDVAALEAAAAAAGAKGAADTVARSDRAILVKNLPYSSDEAELAGLFAEAAGEPPARFVLPPTRALALLEFDDAVEAKRAFRRLAYKNYQHVPLYLEWAPKGIFSGKRAAPKPKTAAAGTQPAAPPAAAAALLPHPEEKSAAAATARLSETSSEATGSSTIFVKNLATAAAALEDNDQRRLRSVNVARKKAPDGTSLSAGFGFVECGGEAAARALIGALQGSVLDGHKLILQLAQQPRGAAGAGADAAGVGTKMIATRKDVLALFSAFGDVKSCRLPRKFDGSHRGFAFVEFSSKQEAKNAVEGVQGTHLYGRRLAIEAAEAEGGLEELRAKTLTKFSGILESEVDKRGPEEFAEETAAKGKRPRKH